MSSRRWGSALQNVSGTLGQWADYAGKKEMMAAEQQFEMTMESLRQQNRVDLLDKRTSAEKDLIGARGAEQRTTDGNRATLRETENFANYNRTLARDAVQQKYSMEQIDARGRHAISAALARSRSTSEAARLKDLTDRERELYDDFKGELSTIMERKHDGKMSDPEKVVEAIRLALARTQSASDVRNNGLFRGHTTMLAAQHIQRIENFVPAEAGEDGEMVDTDMMAWNLMGEAAQMMGALPPTDDVEVEQQELIQATDEAGAFDDLAPAPASPTDDLLPMEEPLSAPADHLPVTDLFSSGVNPLSRGVHNPNNAGLSLPTGRQANPRGRIAADGAPRDLLLAGG